jgi:hypothetical protein
MRHAFGGATLVIAGIAAFIEAHSHAPVYTCGRRGCEEEAPRYLEHGRLHQGTYDLLRIGAWTLVIFGALLIIMGLIRYWATQQHGVRARTTAKHPVDPAQAHRNRP